MASENVFDLFLKTAGKITQKRLTRVDFHRAISATELKLSAPEID